MAQTPAQLFDTPFPSTYNGQGATIVPARDSSQFHFPTITGHADVQQPLATYLQGFPAVSCGSSSESFNISFGFLYTPSVVPGNSTQDYAVHLSILNLIPNNITGVTPPTALSSERFCSCFADQRVRVCAVCAVKGQCV